MQERTWRDAVRGRLEGLPWDRVMADVRPFLEPHVVGSLTRESVLAVL